MIRPEALAFLAHWREVILGGLLAAFGLWVLSRGGLVLGPIGLGLAALGLAIALTGWRRLRFAQSVAAPGVVEVVEGQLSYFGPSFGGVVSLADLTELRLVTLRGRKLWRMKQSDGQALLIPVDAAGADTLYDAFAGLPGFDMPALLALLAPPGTSAGAATAQGLVLADQPDMRLIWSRKGRGIVA
jgi:hypothetical protein